jgi:glycosyltransferase involved in cell wall biosynthesis
VSTVAVCVPTIPPRGELLTRALLSVENQTRQADQVVVQRDDDWEGPSQTRNRCLALVQDCEYTAWLDDDDEFLPNHLRLCLAAAVDNDADLVYPMFTRQDHLNPFRVDHISPFGRPWDARLLKAIMEENNFIPVTTLIRTELLRSVGGFPLRLSEEWPHHANEDWGLWKKLLVAGAKFWHVPEVTWTWHPHGIDRRTARIRQ